MISDLTPGLPPAASELLAGNAPAWEALEDVLRRTPAGIARDTYAHLARWHEATIVRLGDHAAGRPESLVITDFEEVNARWAAEDSQLTLDEARARCLASRDELTRLAASLRPEQWDERALQLFGSNTSGHYEEHLGYLQGA